MALAEEKRERERSLSSPAKGEMTTGLACLARISKNHREISGLGHKTAWEEGQSCLRAKSGRTSVPASRGAPFPLRIYANEAIT